MSKYQIPGTCDILMQHNLEFTSSQELKMRYEIDEMRYENIIVL